MIDRISTKKRKTNTSWKWFVSRQSWLVRLSGENARYIGKIQVAARDIDKEGCVIEVKQEVECGMCDEFNGVWKRDLGHKCRTDKTN